MERLSWPPLPSALGSLLTLWTCFKNSYWGSPLEVFKSCVLGCMFVRKSKPVLTRWRSYLIKRNLRQWGHWLKLTRGIAQVPSPASSEGLCAMRSLEDLSQTEREKALPEPLTQRLKKLWINVSFWHFTLSSASSPSFWVKSKLQTQTIKPPIIWPYLTVLRPHLLPSFLKCLSQPHWFCLGMCVYVCAHRSLCLQCPPPCPS